MKSIEEAQNYITDTQIKVWFGASAAILGIFGSLWKSIQNERDKILNKLNELSHQQTKFEGEINLIKSEQKQSEKILMHKMEALTEKIQHYENTNVKNQVMLMDAIDDFKNILQKK